MSDNSGYQSMERLKTIVRVVQLLDRVDTMLEEYELFKTTSSRLSPPIFTAEDLHDLAEKNRFVQMERLLTR